MNTIASAVMFRAWVIFRQNYNYPAVPFQAIGRKCFASALRAAWRERHEAERIAAIPAGVKAARIAALRSEHALLAYSDNYRQVSHRRAAIDAELHRLAA